MSSIKIKIATDFSDSPGPRYQNEGKYSGEEFRKEILVDVFRDAIENDKKVIVDLDGTFGYGTSFLEESFGGLIRNDNFSYHEIIDRLVIVSTEEDYLISDVYEYLKDANDAAE